jgi:hypothetical protein
MVVSPFPVACCEVNAVAATYAAELQIQQPPSATAGAAGAATVAVSRAAAMTIIMAIRRMDEFLPEMIGFQRCGVCRSQLP